MSPDRSSAPPPSGRIAARLPALERSVLANGLRLTATGYGATPETLIELALPGGRSRERLDQLGFASLVAKAMQEGTAKLSTVELVDALDFLGADLRVASDDDSLTLSLRVLDKHLPAALELFCDVLLEPRFDAADFERVRTLRLAAIATRGDEAARVAQHAWQRLMHGAATSLGFPAMGTEECVRRCTTADLRAFHAAALDPRAARLAVVGRWSAEELRGLLAPLTSRWPAARTAATPPPVVEGRGAAPGLYCVHRPGAPQTELRLGHLSVSAAHPDWLALSALNYPLGGQFTSRINMNLREKRGYTYGARSAFEAALRPAPFVIAAAVHAQHTAASVREVQAELEGFLDGPTEAEIGFTRDALEQSLARQFESPAARLGFVETVERFGWPEDYPRVRLARLDELGAAGLRALAREHLRPRELVVLAVGDRAHLAGLTELGPVRELDIDGAPLATA